MPKSLYSKNKKSGGRKKTYGSLKKNLTGTRKKTKVKRRR